MHFYRISDSLKNTFSVAVDLQNEFHIINACNIVFYRILSYSIVFYRILSHSHSIRIAFVLHCICFYCITLYDKL